jgi:hypothetical protein
METADKACKATEKLCNSATSAQPALQKKTASKGSRKRGRDPDPEPAQQERAGSSPSKSNTRKREPLLRGNVWAHACCGVQVAAQSYHDVKGCQGVAAVACKERVDALAKAPRGRREARETSNK